MVLFIEDEKRIKEMEKREKLAKRTRLGVWTRRFIKIGFVLAFLFGLSIVILSMIGGNNTALKNGIEDYLTQSFGMQAHIGTFNDMRFFPNLHLDAADITFHRDDQDDPAITIKNALFTAGFFDMMFTRNKFKDLKLEQIKIKPGIFTDQSWLIHEFTLKEIENAPPALILNGQHGTEDISASLGMQKSNDTFRIAKNSAFNLTFGRFKMQGTIQNSGWGDITMIVDSIGVPEKILSGEITLNHGLTKNTFTTDLSFGDSTLKTNIDISDKNIKGTITFPILSLDDLKILSQLYQQITQQHRKKNDKDTLISYYEHNVSLDLDIKTLKGTYGDMGHLSATLTLDNQILHTVLSGMINDGKLTSDITLNATALPASLIITSSLQDWDYGLYQKTMLNRENISGRADINLSLESQGKTYDSLIKNISGEAVLIAGQAKMTSSALNIWGAGLVNAMIPSLDADSMTTINCMIADFKIKDSVATPDPLFLDTSRVTVIGDGTINIFDKTIDLKLEPKAKNPALLDVATAVRVKGNLLSPKISADNFSLFEKLGGLALGVVNPAFLVFSMTDLGLTESHPCYQFINKNTP